MTDRGVNSPFLYFFYIIPFIELITIMFETGICICTGQDQVGELGREI